MAGAVAASVEFDTQVNRLIALTVRLGEWVLDHPEHLLLHVAEMRYFYLTDYSRAEKDWLGELYTFWLLHNFELGGVTVALCLLEEGEEELAAWERQELEGMHRQICERRADGGFRLVEVRAAHEDGTLEVEDLYLGGTRTVGTQCLDEPPGVGDLVLALIWPLPEPEAAELLTVGPVPGELAPVVVRRIGALFGDELGRLSGIYSNRFAEPGFDRRRVVDLAEENVFRLRAPQVIHAVIDAMRAQAEWERVRPLEAELEPRWAAEERRLTEWSLGDAAAPAPAPAPAPAAAPAAGELLRHSMGHYRVLDFESLRNALRHCPLVTELPAPVGAETGAGLYQLKWEAGTAPTPDAGPIADLYVRRRHMWVFALWSTRQVAARRVILEVAGDHVAHVLDEHLDRSGPLSSYRQWAVIEPSSSLAVPEYR